MPLFARRQLQSWLDELSSLLDLHKANDLIGRLEDKDPKQALPAEMELAVLWAIASLGDIEIEPERFSPSGRNPEAISNVLIPGFETVIEVTALSDSSLPGEQGMRKATDVIVNSANKIIHGSGKHLRFFYRELQSYSNGKIDRKIKVPRALTMTDALEQSLRNWLNGPPLAEGSTLDISDAELDVQLTWHKNAQVGPIYRSSMPPEVHDIRKNHLWDSLKRKETQLRSQHFVGLRCVIICDAGSTLLRKIGNRSHMETSISGEMIVRKFIQRDSVGIDIIAVISPRRRSSGSVFDRQRTLSWETDIFCRNGLDVDLTHLKNVASKFPKPYFEGYQAQSLHDQGAFSPSSMGWYLGTNFSSMGNTMTAKLSSRAFLDLLAGRITLDRFQSMAGTPEVFSNFLDKGYTIKSLKLESSGTEKDDDYIVIDFADDPSARKLIASK